MKTFYIFISFLLLSVGSFAQTYYTYTATKSGSWNDMSVWSIAVRTDGIHKTKAVIPAPYVVTVDNAVNSFGLGDVEINIMGTLSILPSTTIVLSSASSVSLFGTGKITGTNNTQKIMIGGVTKYSGDLDLNKTGPSIANSTTGISPNGFVSTALLPVAFINFSATKNAGLINLQWSTSSEISNHYFEVERSYNGSAWTTLSTITGTGSANTIANYSYIDNNANNAMVYYRLKQVDLNGSFLYSIVKTVVSENATATKIYNAGGKTINIELGSAVNKNVVVTLMNTNGQVIEKKQFSALNKISMSVNNATPEILIVNVANNDGFSQTSKLLL